jgi:hypothetical protein
MAPERKVALFALYMAELQGKLRFALFATK